MTRSTGFRRTSETPFLDSRRRMGCAKRIRISTTPLLRGAPRPATTGTSTDLYSGSATLPGWTVGAGSEWGISPAWSAKLEYLYVDLGTFSYTSECVNCLANGITNGPFLRTDVTTREHIVRFGLNYRFGGGSR